MMQTCIGYFNVINFFILLLELPKKNTHEIIRKRRKKKKKEEKIHKYDAEKFLLSYND